MGLFLQLAWYVIQFMFVGGEIPIAGASGSANFTVPDGGVWGAFIDFALTPDYQIIFIGLIMWIVVAALGKIERVFKI